MSDGVVADMLVAVCMVEEVKDGSDEPVVPDTAEPRCMMLGRLSVGTFQTEARVSLMEYHLSLLCGWRSSKLRC